MIKLKSPVFAAICTAALFLGIFSSSLLGLWNTESTKEPAKIREGEFAGMPSPSDIRGSYTWNDVEKAFGVPASLLMKAFNSPQADLKVNSLEALYLGKLPEGSEIGTDSVRLFVAAYTGLPHQAEEGTLLPVQALRVLEESGKLDSAALAELNERAFGETGGAPLASAPPASAAPAPSQKPEAPAASHAVTAGSLSGETTFAQLKSWGASSEDIKKVLGGKLGADDEIIKDFCSANGLKFGEVKTKLQALLE